MNQLAVVTAIGLMFGALSPVAAQSGADVVIDDFENYTSAEYVQNQDGASWRRFGVATVDGLYSVANPSGGRAVSYAVNWASGNAGYIRYTFPSAGHYAAGTTFSVDLAVTKPLSGTNVFLLLADGETSVATTTAYRTRVGRELPDTGFQTYEFIVNERSVRRISGGASLQAVLDKLASVTLIFSNADGTGSQSILLDNFKVIAPRLP